MSDAIRMVFSGRTLPPRLPTLLTAGARSADTRADEFLPPGYLQPTGAFDVSAGVRDVEAAQGALHHEAAGNEILVLELADGSTLVTSAGRFESSLAQTRPDLIGADGEILFDKLSGDSGASRDALTRTVGSLAAKVFTFVVDCGLDDPIAKAALEIASKWKKKGVELAELGVTWLGTKALMAAVESKLGREPNLYRWLGTSGKPTDFELANLVPAPKAAASVTQPSAKSQPESPPEPTPNLEEAAKKPLLVFVHGTGSSTLGSFGDLRSGRQDVWSALEHRFGSRIYAFEHRTLSESPISNALQLAQALPKFAHVDLVSHSRGGLVADLLCLRDFDALIDRYAFGFDGIGNPSPEETARVIGELETAHAEQREELRRLAAVLREKQLVIQRYVRVASPARGTLLASGNVDLFLSSLLTLIGQVPLLFGSPWYAAFKRVVIDIAKNRTDPHLVPGIEAMLPDSPLAWLLREAPVQAGIQMATIAGDIEGGNLLARLALMLTDFLFFDQVDNDLVVDTSAMLGGIAPQAGARVLLDRGREVSHFRYFVNQDTRTALRDWLVNEKPEQLTAFQTLPDRAEDLLALQQATSRDAQALDRPVVVILPGVMGSHLSIGGTDRVWFDPLDIAAGGLDKIRWGRPGVEAEALFGLAYGRLCGELAKTHRVVPFPYDWRQPLDVLAERFGEFLAGLMKKTDQPIRLLAHSMGGLVVRACIHRRRPVMDALMSRDGARLLMLGTPNQGAHSMVENLLGKGATLRMLVRLDVRHSMQEVLDIVAGFRGALQLLPKPGFKDTFQGQDGGGLFDYQSEQTWKDLNAKVRDLWFGNGKSGQPAQSVLDSASWLWKTDGDGTPKLPAEYAPKTVYVFGVARNTPCGLRDDKGRLRMVGTTRGDGTVTWDSGRIAGIGHYFYMPAEHGDLAATQAYFPALVELLTSGNTGQLPKSPPVSREADMAGPLLYDAGPPTLEDPDAIERKLLGGSLRERVIPRAKRRLEVLVRACDLRFVSVPIMVGHYEQDPISGPESLIDRELLDGALRERHNLGLYAGARGAATVVLRRANGDDSSRCRLGGAIVIGLGSLDQPLNPQDLTESVRTGVLRYLLQVTDVLGKAEREVQLAAVLIGYNSSVNLSIGASVEALVKGIIEANARFQQMTRLDIRVARLEIVELYLDTAIAAVYALRQVGQALAPHAETLGALLVCHGELQRHASARPRLFDGRAMSYWPRLIVTDADRHDELCPPECCDGAAEDAGQPRAPVADRLRYLYVGARARAESVVQQRQPGLIETLVTQQIHVKRYQEDIGRMLFQLMVPHDFKDAARQLDRVVLVVDSYTANLPWELMFADDPNGRDDVHGPLALRTAIVRQFVSPSFRRGVRQSLTRTALVIGNPAVEGFGKAFPLANGQDRADPPALANAQGEADAIAATLRGLGYAVTAVIGEEARAIDVLAKLYCQPYRILHISAHGVFGVRHRDGQLRSGVVLSDGVLVTAAEIAAMESVPELVFLNCCHLGTVDQPTGRGANKLAASVARELIDIGVRCVVVAGWAVDDAMASTFGQTFYEELLLQRVSFGDAIRNARKAAWKKDSGDITWGAFQAYGEPGWTAERREDGADAVCNDQPFVSPDELLDALARMRAALSRRSGRQTESWRLAQTEQVRKLIESRTLPEWRSLPDVQSALGSTWRQLGRLDEARAALLTAIQAEGDLGRVPLNDIAQLAEVETLLGDRIAKDDPTGGSDDKGLGCIERAISRLMQLGEILTDGGKCRQDSPATDTNRERLELIGNARKTQAAIYARQLKRQTFPPGGAADISAKMKDALVASVGAYKDAEQSLGPGCLDPYLSLNRLAIDLLTPWEPPELKEQAIALAQRCRQMASQPPSDNPSVREAVIAADALLLERLLDDSLGADDDDRRNGAFDAVQNAYADALANLTVTPSELDAITTRIDLLICFLDAKQVVDRKASRERTVDQLRKLMTVLSPTHGCDDSTAGD